MSAADELPPILKVLEGINQLFDPNHWVLKGLSDHRWKELVGQKKPPSEGKAEAIASELWKIRLQSDEAKREQCRVLINQLDPQAKLAEISEDSLKNYLYDRAAKDNKAFEAFAPDSPYVKRNAQRDRRVRNELSNFYWRPFWNRSVAIVAVLADHHHYDQIPVELLTRQIASHVSDDLDFLHYDPGGGPVWPKEPRYNKFDAFCVVGRHGLYTHCPILWESPIGGMSRLPPDICFTLPAVDRRTSRHLKRDLDPAFHKIDSKVGQGSLFYEAKDIVDWPEKRKRRLDYALIQRFCLPETRVFVSIVAGCTALGTLVAAQQVCHEEFSRVRWNVGQADFWYDGLSDEANVEILLKVEAWVEWTEEDQRKHDQNKLVTKFWKEITIDAPLFVCVNGKPLTSQADAKKSRQLAIG